MLIRILAAAFVVVIATGCACAPVSAELQPPAQSRRDQADANKALVRRFLSALEAGDIAAINALTDPAGVSHGSTGDTVRGGPFTELKKVCPMCAALSDRRIAIEYIIAEGDLVTVRSIWTGTYSGTYRDMKVPAPTPVKVIYTNTYRIANGRIGDNYWATDRLALAEALGFTLSPPTR